MKGRTTGQNVATGCAILRLIIVVDFDGTAFDVFDAEDGMDVERDAR